MKAMKIYGLYIFNPHQKETKQAKKSSFSNFFVSFKTGVCSAISWQRSLCFRCTSVKHLLNKGRASPLYSVYPERRNSQFPVAGHPQPNEREKAKPPQGEEKPCFQPESFKQLWLSVPWYVFPSMHWWLAPDGTRAGWRTGSVIKWDSYSFYCRTH